MPRSFMTPASPQNSAWRFQLIGLSRSRSLEWRKAFSPRSARPSAPERIVSNARWAPGKKGISLEQRTKTLGWRRAPRRSGGRRRGRCRTAFRPGGPCRPRWCRGRAARAGGAGRRCRRRRGRVASSASLVVGREPHARRCARTTRAPPGRVADRGEPRRDRVVRERRPAPDRGGQLAAHQAAADDADCRATLTARRGERLVGRRAVVHDRHQRRVMPAGFSCWMMLRP